ncbi:MAG: hypothetical protein EXQ81_08090 [Thermoleophilia bacterium]|nr:hypothetical protein [Thermoleophilia bacterium]
MPIQIEQMMPRCLRCGKLVHARDKDRIENELGLFCSPICHGEYVELVARHDDPVGATTAEAKEGEAR